MAHGERSLMYMLDDPSFGLRFRGPLHWRLGWLVVTVVIVKSTRLCEYMWRPLLSTAAGVLGAEPDREALGRPVGDGGRGGGLPGSPHGAARQRRVREEERRHADPRDRQAHARGEHPPSPPPPPPPPPPPSPNPPPHCPLPLLSSPGAGFMLHFSPHCPSWFTA